MRKKYTIKIPKAPSWGVIFLAATVYSWARSTAIYGGSCKSWWSCACSFGCSKGWAYSTGARLFD